MARPHAIELEVLAVRRLVHARMLGRPYQRSVSKPHRTVGIFFHQLDDPRDTRRDVDWSEPPGPHEAKDVDRTVRGDQMLGFGENRPSGQRFAVIVGKETAKELVFGVGLVEKGDERPASTRTAGPGTQ